MSKPIEPSTRIEFFVEVDRVRVATTRTARDWLGVGEGDPLWSDPDAVQEGLGAVCADWTASQFDSGWGVAH